MFTIKERCTLEPLAKTGVFAKPFVVELSIDLLNLKRIGVAVFVLDEDGLEKRVAQGTYEVKEDMAEKLAAKLKEFTHEE